MTITKSTFRILVVEDTLTNSDILVRRLRRFGYSQIEVVDTGYDALSVCERFRPHFILMDINLAASESGVNLDGAQASKKIKELYPDTVIFAMTANAMEGDRERFTSIGGFDDYLTKPFSDWVGLDRQILALIDRLNAPKVEEKVVEVSDVSSERLVDGLVSTAELREIATILLRFPEQVSLKVYRRAILRAIEDLQGLLDG